MLKPPCLEASWNKRQIIKKLLCRTVSGQIEFFLQHLQPIRKFGMRNIETPRLWGAVRLRTSVLVAGFALGLTFADPQVCVDVFLVTVFYHILDGQGKILKYTFLFIDYVDFSVN